MLCGTNLLGKWMSRTKGKRSFIRACHRLHFPIHNSPCKNANAVELSAISFELRSQPSAQAIACISVVPNKRMPLLSLTLYTIQKTKHLADFRIYLRKGKPFCSIKISFSFSIACLCFLSSIFERLSNFHCTDGRFETSSMLLKPNNSH